MRGHIGATVVLRAALLLRSDRRAGAKDAGVLEATVIQRIIVAHHEQGAADLARSLPLHIVLRHMIDLLLVQRLG